MYLTGKITQYPSPLPLGSMVLQVTLLVAIGTTTNGGFNLWVTFLVFNAEGNGIS